MTLHRWPLFRTAAALVAVSLLALASAASAGAATGDAELPEVAADPSGGRVAFVWKRSDGSHTRIQGRTRTAGGTLSSVVDLSAAGQNADNPQVAVAPDGKATFVWTRRIDGSDDTCCTVVQGRSLNASGGLSGIYTLSAPVGHPYLSPPQLAAGPDGTVMFVWALGDPPFVQARTRSQGGTLGTPFTVAPGSGEGETARAFSPTLSLGPDGAPTFMFGKAVGAGAPVFQGRRRTAGGTLGSAFNVSGPVAFGGGAHVGVDPDGRATFIWHEEIGGAARVRGRRRNPDGTLGGIFDISTPGVASFDPQLTIGPDGRATFAWRQSSDQKIVGRSRTAGGTLGGIYDVAVPNTGAGQGTEAPQLAAAPNDGKVTFTWAFNDGGFPANVIVQARSRTTAGSLGSIVDVSSSTGRSETPQLAVAPDGKVSFDWMRRISQDDGGGTFIQGRARTSGGNLGGILDLSTHPNL